MHKPHRFLLAAAFPLALAAGHALQYNAAPIGRPTADGVPPLGAGHGSEDNSPFSVREMQARQWKMLHAQHQKQVVADTARLVSLATELKAQTDEGVTGSPAERKDVDEIARLARKLEDRIKNE